MNVHVAEVAKFYQRTAPSGPKPRRDPPDEVERIWLGQVNQHPLAEHSVDTAVGQIEILQFRSADLDVIQTCRKTGALQQYTIRICPDLVLIADMLSPPAVRVALLSKLQETTDILRGLCTPDIPATRPVESCPPVRF